VRYIYFDESGDLGFDFSKQGTSERFVITFMLVNNRRPVSTLVKKVFTSLPVGKKRKHSGLLHAYYEKKSTRMKLLGGLATKDIQIATICLNKRKMLIVGNPHELYANIVTSLINRLFADGILIDAEDVFLVASRRNTSKALNMRLSESVVNSARGTKFSIEIIRPMDDRCLQAVDFASWAFWQKYERDNNSYAALLVDKTVREYEMYT
jgi:hypothetical protein